MTNKEIQIILKKYASYFDYIYKLGTVPLCKTPTIEDIKPASGAMQAIYKDIKRFNFDGTLIDYLCWLSMMYLWYTFIENDFKKITELDDISTLREYPVIRNFLRLNNKRPELFIDKLGEDFFKQSFEDYEGEDINNLNELKLKSYNVFNVIWFKEYMKDLELVREHNVKYVIEIVD